MVAKSETMTRQALYDLVWSEPMRTLAKRFEISDVALAKTCRKVNVPTPGLGYWAKKEAGKKTVRTPLLPRGLGESDYVTVAPTSGYYGYGRARPTIDLDAPDPAVPSFEEDIEKVEDRVRRSVGKVTIPPLSSARLHPETQKLQENDNRLRAENAQSRWSFYKPLFEGTIGCRRLRILNALFLSLSRNGAHPDVGRRKQPDIGYRVGEQSYSLRLNTVEAFAEADRYLNRRPKALPKAVPSGLQLEVRSYADAPATRLAWADDAEGKLETKLSEIVVAMIVAGEVDHREWEIESHKRGVEYRATQREERRKAAIERERQERERKAKLEKERVESLLADAKALREAAEIRSYVGTVLSLGSGTSQSSHDLGSWAAWALGVADRHDPLTSGRFKDRMAKQSGS